MNRRQFIAVASLGAASSIRARPAAVQATKTLSEAFDSEMEAYMSARKIPGGALAVTRDGRLVYARGYGWADRDKRISIQSDSLFRIASITKPITASAILALVDQGKL